MKKLFFYFKGVFLSPESTIKEFLNDQKKHIYALVAFIILGIIFLEILVSYISVGFKPWIPPLLIIPLDKYFFVELIISAPITLLMISMAAGFAFWLASLFKGKGDFINFFYLLIFLLVVPIYFWWIIDKVTFILIFFKILKAEVYYRFAWPPGFGIIVNMIALLLSIIWNSYVISIGLSINQKISRGKSLIVSIITSVCYYAIWFGVFFR